MPNQTCDCCGSTAERVPGDTASADRWLVERPVTNASLPDEMERRIGQFFGRESVDTLGDVATAIREATGGGSLATDDLCHVAAETSHRATTEDETYHFRCFYDGVALAHLADKSVEISTESPTGEPITVQASSDGEIDVSPPGAAMSFGIAASVDTASPNGPIQEEAYEAFCPYVRAFDSREDYEHWAEDIGADTVGMPLVAGVSFAAALTQ